MHEFSIEQVGDGRKPDMRMRSHVEALAGCEIHGAEIIEEHEGTERTSRHLRQHAIHLFGVNVFNAGNRLYRNHLSFIKDVAPEIGRGISVSYSVRFF